MSMFSGAIKTGAKILPWALGALGAKQAVDSSLDAADKFGYDPYGTKGRERMALDSQVESALLNEQEMVGGEISEQLLQQMLSPFSGIEGQRKDPVLAGMEMDESLRNLLMANEMELGQLSRPLPGPSLEEMALSMGY